MTGPLERLMRLIRVKRTLTIPLDEATEMRLVAFLDRLNMTGSPEDHSDPESDEDLRVALLVAADMGLIKDEGDHGLEGMPWGDILSREQADEIRRRRAR